MVRGFPFVLTLLGVLAAAAAAHAQSRSQGIDAGDWGSFLKAREQYQANCTPCHGLEGAAPLTYAPSFALGEGLNVEFGVLLLTLQNGGLYMPPWESMFSYEEQEWLIRYVQVLPGDNVFRAHCASCHGGAVPALPAGIPHGAALAAYGGPIHVTSGPDVSPTWNAEDRAKVVRLLRALEDLP